MSYSLTKGTLAVLQKDLLSEFRSRYSISAIFLFIVTTIVMIVVAVTGEKLKGDLSAGLIWIIMFFSSMTGLAKSFVSEEERGTSLLLKISASAGSVYFGKLIFNILLSIIMNILAILMFSFFVESVSIKSPDIFAVTFLLGSLGLASATTIIAAIIARANTKGALFPILSFPLLLPLIVTGIDVTRFAFDGKEFGEAMGHFQIMFAYCGLVISVSFILFSLIWED